MTSQFWSLLRSNNMAKNKKKKKKNRRGGKWAGFRCARASAISHQFRPSKSQQLCLVVRSDILEGWFTFDLDDDHEKKMMTIDAPESNFKKTQKPNLQLCSLPSSTSMYHHHKIYDFSKEETQNPNFLQKCSLLQCCSSCNMSESPFVHLNMHHPSLRVRSICTIKLKVLGSFGAALGSTSFYRIGGLPYQCGTPIDSCKRLSRKVFLFDTATTTRPCWKRVAPMRHGRAWGKALAVDGKLYALGGQYNGCNHANCRYWGEIYDPVTDSWTPMIDPPRILPARSFQAWFDHDSSSILVISPLVDSDYLDPPPVAFRYLVRKNEWVASYSDAPEWCLPYPNKLHRVLVGTTSFWICCACKWSDPYDPLGGFTRICAYDFEDKTFFMGPLHMNVQMQKLFNNNRARDGPLLIHLVGDIFLVFWMQRIDDKVHIQCTKLQVHKCMGNITVDDQGETFHRYGQLHVTVLSCQTHPLNHDHYFYTIEDAMLL